MDQWNANGGGFYNDAGTPDTQNKTKLATRQQFLCPVTIRQLLEAPEDGLKIGGITTSMIQIVGVVVSVDVTSTNVRFTLSDDTGYIECLDWLESEDGGEPKKSINIMENAYYTVFGCIKSPQGKRRIMVFKVNPIEDFNQYAAFMAEVLSFNTYALKRNQGGCEMMMVDNPGPAQSNTTSYEDYGTSFTPIQKAVLDAIKAVTTQIGWNKNDPNLKAKFNSKQLEEALDFLVGEGHIYSTVDDDHYSST